MKPVLERAKELQDNMLNYRHALHQIPEICMELPQTYAYVKRTLIEMGYKITDYGESSLSVVAGDSSKGKVVLLRADMDALPIKEQTELPFASNNDFMHACGHDLHTSMLLGAARILKENEDSLKGAVKLMFQPGEESLQGAKYMIENGVLKNPMVDVAMMIHVFTGLPVPAGYFLLPNAGATSAASDWFEIVVKGKGGHGAMPEFTVDPLNIISHIHLALQSIISREIAAADSAVVTVGLMEGGATKNIIPDTARLKGTVRTFNPKTRDFIEKRIIEIAKGIADVFRATAEVNYTRGCPSIVNDSDVIHALKEIIIKYFGPEQIMSIDQLIDGGKMMGSEDFSFVTQEVPSVMLAISAGNSNNGFVYPMHHPKALFEEDILYKGAAIYTQFAIDFLNK